MTEQIVTNDRYHAFTLRMAETAACQMQGF
jgi:hypothetical protein